MIAIESAISWQSFYSVLPLNRHLTEDSNKKVIFITSSGNVSIARLVAIPLLDFVTSHCIQVMMVNTHKGPLFTYCVFDFCCIFESNTQIQSRLTCFLLPRYYCVYWLVGHQNMDVFFIRKLPINDNVVSTQDNNHVYHVHLLTQHLIHHLEAL